MSRAPTGSRPGTAALARAASTQGLRAGTPPPCDAASPTSGRGDGCSAPTTCALGRVAAVTVPSTGLQGLALSRATVDRTAGGRRGPGLLEALLADPATAVAVLAGDTLLVEDAAGGPTVALLSPAELPEGLLAVAQPLFLGPRADGRGYVAVAVPAGPPDGLAGGSLQVVRAGGPARDGLAGG